MKQRAILTCLFLCIFAVMSHAQGKLFSFTQGGLLIGNSDNTNSAPFILNTSLNYAFTRHLSAGVGVGVEFLRETHLPVTANILYQFGNKTVVPFVMLRAGYQVALESKLTDDRRYYLPYDSYYGYGYYSPPYKLDAKGGFMADPSVGVIFRTKLGFNLSLSAGYRYQKLNYEGENDYKLNIEYNRLTLQAGIIF